MASLFKWLLGRAPKPAEAPAVEEPPVEVAAPLGWRALGASVRGASHLRSGAPNQDAIDWWADEANGWPLVLAVADGHGSAKCFRSDVGAKLAVQTALETCRVLLGESSLQDASSVKRSLEEGWPQELERRWKSAVSRHLEEFPLLAREVNQLEAEQGLAARKQVEAQEVLAYGATLLIVMVHAEWFACLQLGDGDIVVVDEQGHAVQPMEEDARLLANETTSLSGNQAWREFRTTFQSLSGHPPALLLASTDGYSNSFRDAADYLAVGTDLLSLLAEEGPDAVARDLPEWLEEASRQGSGDDVTLGVVWRDAALDAYRSRQANRDTLAGSPELANSPTEPPGAHPINIS